MTNSTDDRRADRLGIVVHGHRDGNAVAQRPRISAECLARVRAAERATDRFTPTDVLLCGAGAPGFPSEARQMADAWLEPRARIWLDEDSVDSAQNAQRALQWAEIIGATQLLVVSSWWHLRLPAYYRPFRSRGVAVRHARTRRLDRVVRHVAHELRYLPRALRRGPLLDVQMPDGGPVLYRGVGPAEDLAA